VLECQDGNGKTLIRQVGKEVKGVGGNSRGVRVEIRAEKEYFFHFLNNSFCQFIMSFDPVFKICFLPASQDDD